MSTGSVERDTLAAALAQQAADGEPSATMAAMAGIAAVESGIESAKTAARLAASNTNNNNGGVPMPPAHSREMAVKAAGAASAAGDAWEWEWWCGQRECGAVADEPYATGDGGAAGEEGKGVGVSEKSVIRGVNSVASTFLLD